MIWKVAMVKPRTCTLIFPCPQGPVIKLRGGRGDVGYEKLGVGHYFSTCQKGWVRKNNALKLAKN